MSSKDDKYTEGPQYSGGTDSISYEAFVRDLAKNHPSRTLDSLFSEEKFALDGTALVSELAFLLTALGIPGPATSLDHLSHLGIGTHFTVDKENVTASSGFGFESSASLKTFELAAVKRPKFLLDADIKLDLLDSNSNSRQVHSIVLEITALCHPQLYGHPNLVEFLAWGIDESDLHPVPFIVLEVADMDLAALVCGDNTLSISIKFDLMRDVARGLDVIHQVGLFHGDLKPANVLVFGENDVNQRWVAKIADFGGAANMGKDNFWEGGGTVGWRAPEVCEMYDSGEPPDLSMLDRADNYSYGLLLWSIFLREKAIPPYDDNRTEAEKAALADLAAHAKDMPALLISILEYCFNSLLKQPPHLRNERLEDLLDDGIEETTDRDVSSLSQRCEGTEAYQPWIGSLQVNWDIPEISGFFVPIIRSAYARGQNIPPAILHSMILRLLSYGPRLDFNIEDRDLLLSLMCTAARQGQRPSKFTLFQVHRYFGVGLPPDISCAKVSWIAEGVAAGCFFLRPDLRQLDAESYAASINKFRASGGFNSAYADPLEADSFRIIDEISQDSSKVEVPGPKDGYGDSALHIAAALDQQAALLKLLCHSSMNEINAVNDFGETPLYRACKTGSTAIVLNLLSYGADASIPSEDGPRCLHWIFHFEENDIDHVVDQLIVHGAKVDAQSTQTILIEQAPFSLPVGTALQWSVEMSVPKAVSALLRHGANPYLRDGRDPYKYDRDVRDLDRIHQPNNLPFSIVQTPTMGLNAFDLAVQNHDPSILQMLLSKESAINIASQVDEEGYSALHRLDAGGWFTTREGGRVWKNFYKESKQHPKEAAILIIKLLRDHAFQLDQLTNPQDRKFAFKLSPLMMAVSVGNCHTAEALIEVGANVNTYDNFGRTALSHIGGRIADINLQDERGRSPLGVAALQGDKKMGLVLLERGADICVRGGGESNDQGYGQNVISSFCRCRVQDIGEHEEWMTMVLMRFVLPYLSGRDTIVAEHVRQEVFTNADINGGSLLHFTARAGLAKCCSLLLEQGFVKCNQLRRYSTFRKRSGINSLVKNFRTPLDEALEAVETFKEHPNSRISKKDQSSFLHKYDETVAILQKFGGVRATVLEPQAFVPGDIPVSHPNSDLSGP